MQEGGSVSASMVSRLEGVLLYRHLTFHLRAMRLLWVKFFFFLVFCQAPGEISAHILLPGMHLEAFIFFIYLHCLALLNVSGISKVFVFSFVSLNHFSPVECTCTVRLPRMKVTLSPQRIDLKRTLCIKGVFSPSVSNFVLFNNKYCTYIVSPRHGHYYSSCFHPRKYRQKIRGCDK